jgi:thiamine biosynthesis lipoprotein ApbE
MPAGGGGSPAAVADALSTAFMIQPTEEIDALCQAFPGLEAWLVPEAGEGAAEAPALLHLGTPAA